MSFAIVSLPVGGSVTRIDCGSADLPALANQVAARLDRRLAGLADALGAT